MRSKVDCIHLTVPVFIYAHDRDGRPFKEITRTLTATANGGLVELARSIAKEYPLLVINMATGRSVSCHIKSVQMRSNGKAVVKLRFAAPSPEFWGLEFPLEELRHDVRTRREPAKA